MERAPRPERREEPERKMKTAKRESELALMGGVTAASLDHPDRRNEDALFMDPKRELTIVADGMGGVAGGKEASETVVKKLPEALDAAEKAVESLPGREAQKEWSELIRGAILITEKDAAKNPGLAAKFKQELQRRQEYLKNLKAPREVQDMALAMRRALAETNASVVSAAEKDPALKGMGSTAVASKLMRTPDGRVFAVLGSVGDSMIRIRRSDGKIEVPLPSDSAMDHAIATGMISEEDADPKNLRRGTMEWRMRFLIVAQALGKERGVIPRVTIAELAPGDRLLLASDGIEDNDLDADYERTLGEEAPDRDMTTLAERMRARAEDGIARNEGKGWDDITAVVIEVKPAEEEIELGEEGVEIIAEEPVDKKQVAEAFAQKDIAEFHRGLKELNLAELRSLKEKIAEQMPALPPKTETKKRVLLEPEQFQLKLVEEEIEEKELLL